MPDVDAAADSYDSSGRAAQRRRTRRAIVEATTALITAGHDPSINEIAAAADVSRRTIYMYFPSLDHLLLDATLGAMSMDVDAALDAASETDVHARVLTMITTLADGMAQTLPLGRKIIKLTVDLPSDDSPPRRGYRRIGWIEKALAPVRGQLGRRRFEQLVSALACLTGWESFIVLSDTRGLSAAQARKIVVSSALTLVDAALAEAAAQ